MSVNNPVPNPVPSGPVTPPKYDWSILIQRVTTFGVSAGLAAFTYYYSTTQNLQNSLVLSLGALVSASLLGGGYDFEKYQTEVRTFTALNQQVKTLSTSSNQNDKGSSNHDPVLAADKKQATVRKTVTKKTNSQ